MCHATLILDFAKCGILAAERLFLYCAITLLYSLVDLHIDTDTETVFRGSERIDISGLNFKLLKYFLEKGLETVSFDELIEGVWSPTVVNNETVTQRVRLLRVALNDSHKKPKYIRSVRGVGYQLCTSPTLPTAKILKHQNATKHFGARLLAPIIAFVATITLIAIMQTVTKERTTQASVNVYEKALDRASYFLNIGQLDDIDRAVALLKEFQTEGKSDVRWLILKSRALSAQVCRAGADYKQLDTAKEYAQLALYHVPRSIPAQHALAYSYDCAGKIDDAINAYRDAIAWDEEKQYVGIRSSLAYLIGETGRLAESLALNYDIYHSSVYANKEDFAALQLARNYALLQYNDLAEYYYALSFTLYPENVFSNAAYPRFLFSIGKHKAAEEALQVALSRPKHADLYTVKAELHLEYGNSEAALNAIRKALSFKQSYAPFKTLESVINSDQNQALLQRRREDLIGAANDPFSLLELALIDVSLGNKESASEALHLAIQRGYLDIAYLRESNIYEPLRTLDAFPNLANAIQNIVAVQRAYIPNKQTTLARKE